MVTDFPLYPEHAEPHTGFLHVYESEKTRENYREALKMFLQSISQPEPDLSTNQTCNEIAVRYFAGLKNGRNCVHDLMHEPISRTYEGKEI